MKNKEEALGLVLRAMKSADPAVRGLEYHHTITGYFGFTSCDVKNYVSFIENELDITITDDDVNNRLSSTIGDAVNFLIELTIDKNESN